MASTIVQFSTTSNDLATFKFVDLDSTDGAFANTAAGHYSVSFSAQSNGLYTPADVPAITLGLAWCDCTTSGTGGILGVSKYKEVVLSCGLYRYSNPNNLSGDWSFCAMNTLTVPVTGIGPCVDRRSSPVLGIRRILMVGCVNLYEAQAPIKVLITPSKIA